MHRILKSTAVVFAGALLLSGCATSGGGDSSAAGACDDLRTEVRGISNGAQNTLATATDPAAATTSLEEYQARVDTLAADADKTVAASLDGLTAALDEGIAYAETVSEDATDDEALAAAQTGIQEAAAAATAACEAE